MPTKSLVDMRRKTRQRLQQELQRRREIVRFDNDDAAHLTKPTAKPPRQERVTTANKTYHGNDESHGKEQPALKEATTTTTTTTPVAAASSCLVT